MASYRHTHWAAQRETVGGDGRCEAPRNCVRKAHGGVVFVETCPCGARRRAQSTGGSDRTEQGAWHYPPVVLDPTQVCRLAPRVDAAALAAKTLRLPPPTALRPRWWRVGEMQWGRPGRGIWIAEASTRRLGHQLGVRAVYGGDLQWEEVEVAVDGPGGVEHGFPLVGRDAETQLKALGFEVRLDYF